MALITLKRFDNPVDAHLLKSKLESEDIPCFLLDENTVTLNPLYNVAVGGIRLQVMEEHMKQAQAILQSIEGTPYTTEKGEVLKCPSCGSENITSHFHSIKGVRAVLLAIATALLAYPFYKNRYKCEHCGEVFKSES